MTQTQLASMFLGKPSEVDKDSIDGSTGEDVLNKIIITHGQSNDILDEITAKNIIDDSHVKSLETTLETYRFRALADKRYAEHLEKRNRIIIPDEDGTLIEFVIAKAEKYKDREGYKVAVFADASYFEIRKGSVIYPNKYTRTLSQHAGFALNNSGWRVGIVESTGTRTLEISNHTNPLDFLKRLAREFDVEMRFRVEHNGNRITGRYVDLLERVGEWRGREITFGKDLDGIRRIEKQDIVTALLGLGPERADGTRLEVLVEDKDALQRWGRVDEHGNLHHLIEPYEIESERMEMTESEARQYTRTALDKRINTQVTYETTVVDLENVTGMQNKKIRFGDTMRIKDTTFRPPLYLEARVFEQERSIKFMAKRNIKLGDYIEYTEEQIQDLWRQMRESINKRLDRIAIASISSSAGNVFKNAEGMTVLTTRTFVGGSERDEDGTLYDYQWMKFDKDGNHDTTFYEQGKTISVSASDIDEKATYRVLVAYELEVISIAEITISNVFDGADGEPGKDGKDGRDGADGEKGDKGEPGEKGDDGKDGQDGADGQDGQSVDDITPQYYKSDSETSQTGGSWSESKSTWEPNKYLWTRNKITYSNPNGTEFTSPVLDDSWQAITTADGKNTIIPSETEPSTNGRKIGDAWWELMLDGSIVIHTFNGIEWVKMPLGEHSILADSITATHIKSLAGLNVNDQFIVDANGNVVFSGHLVGATGSFISSGGSGVEESILNLGDGKIELRNHNNSKNMTLEYQSISFKDSSLPAPTHIEALYSLFGIQYGYRHETNPHIFVSLMEMYGNPDTGVMNLGFTIPGSRINLKAEDVYAEGNVRTQNNMYIGTGAIHADAGNERLSLYAHNIGVADAGASILLYKPNTSADMAGNFRFYAHGSEAIRGDEDNVRVYNHLRIMNDKNVIAVGTYNNTYTATSQLMRVTNLGTYGRSTSSRRYKLVEEEVDLEYAKRILNIKAKNWFDKRACEDYAYTLETGKETEIQKIERIGGVIAEDVHDAGLGMYVEYDERDRPEGIHTSIYSLFLPLIQDLYNQLEELKNGN